MIEFRGSPEYILGQNYTVKIYDKLKKVKRLPKKNKINIGANYTTLE
jgi:hypothetical protein